MASPPSIADFYAESRLGNLFGVLGPYYGPRGHLGVDVIHGPRVPVPSWCRGRVVVSTFYSKLGQTVIIDRDDGVGFAGFCHLTLESGVPVGRYVNVGDVVGAVGSTGTSSSGPHLHATLEPTSAIGTTLALDPLPHIRAAVASSLALAGAGVTPIQAAAPLERDDQMLVYANTETNVWAAGVPFGGVWQGIPAGQGDAYVKASGRELVRVNGAEFATIAAICRQRSNLDTRVYADVASNVWRLVGPGVDYEIPSSKAGLFESIYGTRVAVSSADLAAIREAMAATTRDEQTAGVIAALSSIIN